MTKQSGFQDIGSDVNWIDYHGMWGRPIAGTRKWHVIRFDNLEDSCGRDYREMGGRYSCDLLEVDLDSNQITSALESCGWEEGETLVPLWENRPDAEIVECLARYGAFAPLQDDISNNAHKLRDSARKLSYELEGNATEYERLMERPVNRIGSTAREFQQGDIHSAILRGVSAGDPAANLMAKIGMIKA